MEQQKKYDVFISYSRKDSAIADEICQAFDSVGVTYFIDRKGMGGTANYVTKIAEEIDNSKAMLLLASANSYKSKYVSIELHYAFNHDVVVLPYALDETPTPKDFEILLIHANWHYFKEDPIVPTLLISVSELVNKDITSISTPEPTPIPTPVPQPTPKSINKSWIWIAVAAVVMIVLVILGVRYIQQRPTIDLLVDTEQYVQDSVLPLVQIQDSITKVAKTTNNTIKTTKTTNPQSISSTQKDITNSSPNIVKKLETQQAVEGNRDWKNELTKHLSSMVNVSLDLMNRQNISTNLNEELFADSAVVKFLAPDSNTVIDKMSVKDWLEILVTNPNGRIIKVTVESGTFDSNKKITTLKVREIYKQ